MRETLHRKVAVTPCDAFQDGPDLRQVDKRVDAEQSGTQRIVKIM